MKYAGEELIPYGYITLMTDGGKMLIEAFHMPGTMQAEGCRNLPLVFQQHFIKDQRTTQYSLKASEACWMVTQNGYELGWKLDPEGMDVVFKSLRRAWEDTGDYI